MRCSTELAARQHRPAVWSWRGTELRDAGARCSGRTFGAAAPAPRCELFGPGVAQGRGVSCVTLARHKAAV